MFPIFKKDEIKQSKLKAVIPIANRYFAPFIMDGTVALHGVPGEPSPVKIVTPELLKVLSWKRCCLSATVQTGGSVLVRGIKMGFIDVPLHKVSRPT